MAHNRSPERTEAVNPITFVVMEENLEATRVTKAAVIKTQTATANGGELESSKALVPRGPMHVSCIDGDTHAQKNATDVENVGPSTSTALVPRAALPVGVARADDTVALANAESEAQQTGARLERAREVQQQTKVVALHEAKAKVGNMELTAHKVEQEIQIERAREVERLSLTDDGRIEWKRYTEYERFTYRRVFHLLTIAADAEGEEIQVNKKERCIDFCCQALTCNFARMTHLRQRASDVNPAVQAKALLTSVLRRARARGWTMECNFTCPLMGKIFREVVVSLELFIAIFGLVLSVVTFFLDKKQPFNIFHLVLIILGAILAVIDSFCSLSGCHLAKWCRRGCKGSNNTNEDEACCCHRPCNNCRQEQKCCMTCRNKTKTVSDVGRILVAEALFYPILICDVFEIVLQEPYTSTKAADILSVILFIISLLAMLFYVYILRLVVLFGAICQTYKNRKPPKDQHVDFDYTVSKSGLYFQCYLFYHVAMQMLAQIFMIFAIGSKIRYENRHLFESDNTDESIHVSSYLWYMMVAGYLLPFLGLFSFFIVTYYWVQEFPIGLCVDVLKLLQLPGMEFVTEFKDNTKDHCGTFNNINKNIHLAELKKDFQEMRTKKWFDDKFLYPFKSPILVVLCLIYAGLQLGFVVCAGVTVSEGSIQTQLLAGGGWSLFFIAAVIVGFVANLYVFAVAVFWGAVIIFILVVIAICLMLIVLVCLLCCLAQSSNSNNNTQRSGL